MARTALLGCVLASSVLALLGIAFFAGFFSWVFALLGFGALVSAWGIGYEKDWGPRSALVGGLVMTSFMLFMDLLAIGFSSADSFESMVASDPVGSGWLGAATLIPLFAAVTAGVVVLRGAFQTSHATPIVEIRCSGCGATMWGTGRPGSVVLCVACGASTSTPDGRQGSARESGPTPTPSETALSGSSPSPRPWLRSLPYPVRVALMVIAVGAAFAVVIGFPFLPSDSPWLLVGLGVVIAAALLRFIFGTPGHRSARTVQSEETTD